MLPLIAIMKIHYGHDMRMPRAIAPSSVAATENGDRIAFGQEQQKIKCNENLPVNSQWTIVTIYAFGASRK